MIEATTAADQTSADLDFQKGKKNSATTTRDKDAINKKITEFTAKLTKAKATLDKTTGKVDFLKKKMDNAQAAADTIKKALAPKKTPAEIFAEA